MKASDLPASVWIGVARTPEELAPLLDQAANRPWEPFRYFDRATGASRTCRVLFQRPIAPYTKTTPLPPHTSAMAAQSFFDRILMREARYDPPQAPRDCRPGWEVRKATVEGGSFVVVWACWVTPEGRALGQPHNDQGEILL